MNIIKKLLLTTCLAACVQLSQGQNTVESIRQRYADAKAYIEQHKGSNNNDGSDWAEYYHMEARHFLPGTGGHKEDVYMYFNEKEVDAIYPPHYLTFATSKYNYAAREYYDEYLYDSDGKPAFIYAYMPMEEFEGHPDSMEYELRFYLSRGKLIKMIVKNRANDKLPFTEVYAGKTLKEAYKNVFAQYMAKAGAILKMFEAIENEAYNN